MADSKIWGTLNRAVNDATLVDEAIDQAITAHNDNVDAHLGVDQSLQSHRAAEIIDHLAESVVNDKISPQARRYIAIVDPTSEYDFSTVESAVQYAASKGGGDIFIKRGTHFLSGDLQLTPGISLFGEGIDETIITSSSDVTIGIGAYTLASTLSQGALAARGNSEDGYCGVSTEGDWYMPVIGDKWKDYTNGEILTVADVIDQYSVVFSPIPDHVVDEIFDIIRYYESSFIHNSDVVVLNAAFSPYMSTILPGMTLVDISENSLGVIAEVLTGTSVRLTQSYAGTTGVKNVVVNYVSTIRQSIEELTIYKASGHINIFQLVYSVIGEVAIDFVRCGLKGGNIRYDFVNPVNLYNTMIECSIEIKSQTSSDYLKDLLIDRCRIIALSTNARMASLSGKTVITNTEFLANGFSGVFYFDIGGDGAFLENNNIELTGGTTISGSAGTFGRLAGNTISLSGTNTLTISCPNIILSENMVTLGGSSVLSIPSGVSNSIVLGNITNKTWTIANSSKVVANNLGVV